MSGLQVGRFKVPPFRGLEDFLLDKKRYQLPEDVVRCNKRVLNNLHYYETNYYAVLLLISIFISWVPRAPALGLCNERNGQTRPTNSPLRTQKNSYLTPAKWFIGFFAVLLSIGSFIYFSSKQPQFKSIYEDHPFCFMFLNLLCAYFVVYFLDCVSVFILSITTPLLIIFVHASLRAKGKESVSSQSPMAFFLKWCQLLPKE